MTERITTADIHRQIDMVKLIAAEHGATVATYGGYPVSTLHLRQENGTCWLSVSVDGGGTADIGYARGNREVYTFLTGMVAALDMLRHTKAGE